MKYTAIMLLVLLAGCDSARYEFTINPKTSMDVSVTTIRVGVMTDTYTGKAMPCIMKPSKTGSDGEWIPAEIVCF